MTSIIPTVVDVTTETLDNGDRIECYKWDTPLDLLGDGKIPHFTLPIPMFPLGSFCHPSWRQKAKAEYREGTFQFVLPYPESNEDDVTWRFDEVEVRARPNEKVILLPMTSTLNYGPEWSSDQSAVLEAKYDFARIGLFPRKLRIFVKIVGECHRNIGSDSDSQGDGLSQPKRARLSPLIQTAFNTPELSDFKIICEEETFFCHKFILSIGSSFFKRMFLSDTKENQECQVTIVDVRRDILTLALAWMYGEDISAKVQGIQHQQIIELYQSAHRFFLDALKESLVDNILLTVTAETAFDLYLLGDTYQEEKFKNKAIEVMKRERETVFSSNEEVFQKCFQRFPGLLQEIMMGK